nr:recombinase family protein [uncultured Solibaculum sp.]
MKAAAYARYSTDKQTENSIAYQMEAIQKYCRQHQIDLCAFYSDEAESGTNTNRPGFQNLMVAASRREFDAVVIYDISRGSRDVVDWFSFRKSMAALGIQVISTTQELGDITNPSDFLMELITTGLGQHQVLDTRKKSMAGMKERAKKGLYCGGHAPLGYDIVDGKYVINEREAAIVRSIFRQYADGASYGQILDSLKGKTGKFGRPFGKNSFSSILSNERYTGIYKWNERNIRVMRKWAGGKKNPDPIIIDGIIPRIVDDETWRKVKERMSKKERRAANKAKREYLLSGLIECASCGAAYVGHCNVAKRKDGSIRETRYYECGNKYRTKTCNNRNINADELEVFVCTQLQSYLSDIDIDQVAKEYADLINGASPDCEAERRELVEVERQIQNGIKAVLSGMDIPELHAEIDRCRDRKLELEEIIAEKEKNGSQKVTIDEIRHVFRWALENYDTQNRKKVIQQFVKKIYANVDGSCTVHIGIHTIGAGDRT